MRRLAPLLVALSAGALSAACDLANAHGAPSSIAPPSIAPPSIAPPSNSFAAESPARPTTARTIHDTVDVTPEAVAKGRVVFRGAGTCAVCHGQALEGGVGPTLRAHAWKDAKGGDLAAIYAVVQHGVPGTAMAAHPGGINDVQAMQVASYVWAVSHDHAKP